MLVGWLLWGVHHTRHTRPAARPGPWALPTPLFKMASEFSGGFHDGLRAAAQASRHGAPPFIHGTPLPRDMPLILGGATRSQRGMTRSIRHASRWMSHVSLPLRHVSPPLGDV